MRLHIAIQEDGAVGRPVNRSTGLGRDDSVEGIGILGSGLIDKRSVEVGEVNRVAATEGRLSAELLQHQLLDGVVEEAEAGLDGKGPGVASDFMQPSLAGAGAPGDADRSGPNCSSTNCSMGL